MRNPEESWWLENNAILINKCVWIPIEIMYCQGGRRLN